MGLALNLNKDNKMRAKEMSWFLRIGLAIVICNCCFGFAWVGPRIQLLNAILSGSNVEMELVAPITIPLQSAELVVFCVYLFCLPGLLLGKRLLRRIFLGALLLMVMAVVVDESAWIFVGFSELLSEFKSEPVIGTWVLTGGIRWILWFLLNYWFFVVKTRGIRLLTFPIVK